MSQLGETIKRRRLALGQSRGQLASSLGTTATVVASLERGERVPDGETVSRLAKAFGVEPHDLTGEDPPAHGGVDAVPHDATAMVAAPMATAAIATGPDVRAPEADRRTNAAAAPPPAPPVTPPPFPAPQPETVFDEMDRIPVVAAEVAASRPARSAALQGAAAGVASHHHQARPADMLDAPTEAVPVVEQRAVVVVPAPAPAAAEPTTGLYASYRRFLLTLFDRDKPYLFWIRVVLTVVALLIGLRVLAWAVPAFFDALGDILSTIESTNPPATTIPGN